MELVLSAVLPIFGLILAGYVCGRRNTLGDGATDSLNRFVVYLALPALLFLGAAHVNRATAGPPGFLVAFSAAMMASFALSFALERRAGHRVADSAIAGLGGGYANTGFMGIPLCLALFGPAGLQPALMASLPNISGLFAVALVLIEFDLQSAPGLGRTLLKVAGALARNPLVVAPLAGFALDLSGLGMPPAVLHFMTLLGDAASPCALVTIGLFLSHRPDPAHVPGDQPAELRSIVRQVATKLLVQPGVTWLCLLALERWQGVAMPTVWSASAILIAALPTGTGPFMLAKLYDREAASISRVILVSTILSVVSITLLVAGLVPGPATR
ncbi:AEC family transporter [Lichenicoccus roseus]|uniref:AEC family transporter n=1 Tax=Lichenicoccus roseus TaxID=2683649 RepID=A0A5R9J6J7_9PROT|nr:AEC family transporter [Lichenicoccus roseus]TLU72483.1 AEC family transporter [Lichenicoccus roseus]